MKPRRRALQHQSESGSVIAEAAIALPLFFFVVLVGLEGIRGAVAALSLQFIADESARAISLGCSAPDDCSDAGRMTKVRDQLDLYTQAYGINIRPAQICITAQGQSGCSAFGGKRDLVRLNLELDIQLLGLSSLRYTVQGESIFRNES